MNGHPVATPSARSQLIRLTRTRPELFVEAADALAEEFGRKKMFEREEGEATEQLAALQAGGDGDTVYARFLAEQVLPELPFKFDDSAGAYHNQFRALWGALPVVKQRYPGHPALRQEIPVMDTSLAARGALLVAFFDDDSPTPNPALPPELRAIPWEVKGERYLTGRRTFLWLTNGAEFEVQAHLEEIAVRALERLTRSLSRAAVLELATPKQAVPVAHLSEAEREVLLALQRARSQGKCLTAKELAQATGMSPPRVARAIRALPTHGYELYNPQNGTGYVLLD